MLVGEHKQLEFFARAHLAVESPRVGTASVECNRKLPSPENAKQTAPFHSQYTTDDYVEQLKVQWSLERGYLADGIRDLFGATFRHAVWCCGEDIKTVLRRASPFRPCATDHQFHRENY
jgi:hypothetical protein